MKDMFKTIFDSIPAWIFFKDRENRFIAVNKAFCHVMEMTKSQLEGKFLFDIYPREHAESYWNDDKKVFSSGKPLRDIIEPLDSKNGTYWVRTDKIPYIGSTGEIIGVIGFSIDITELKKAEEELKKLHAEEIRVSNERKQELEQLRDAHAQIKELKKILPICSYCKNIRDEKGNWSSFENYVARHTRSNFSHGICPECLKRNFPEHSEHVK